mgnify:CR=1 FL=1
MNTSEEIRQLIEDKIITREQFSDKVEKMYVMQDGNISFMEIVIYTAEYFQIDLDDISKYITKRLRDRIESEAIAENMLHVSAREKNNTLNVFFAAA